MNFLIESRVAAWSSALRVPHFPSIFSRTNKCPIEFSAGFTSCEVTIRRRLKYGSAHGPYTYCEHSRRVRLDMADGCQGCANQRRDVLPGQGVELLAIRFRLLRREASQDSR